MGSAPPSYKGHRCPEGERLQGPDRIRFHVVDPVHPRHRPGRRDGADRVQHLAGQRLVELQIGVMETGRCRRPSPAARGPQGKAAPVQAGEEVNGQGFPEVEP